MKCCEYIPSDHINKTSFSLQLKNEPSKLECYNTPGWKGFPLTNSLAYWAHLYVTKNTKCCEHGPRFLVCASAVSFKKCNNAE